MGEEEILQMEAERLRQLSEEEDEMRQVSERDGFRKDEHLIQACDGTMWELHLHEDGRQYYYCLDTHETKWTLPVVGEKVKSDEVVGSPLGNELEMEAALDSSSSTPKTESTRAFQGSVNSLGEKDFSSTIRDSGPRADGDAPTSGSPDEEGIPGNQANIAGAQHLDREETEALSEGGAAMELVDPEEKMPNEVIGTVSAAEERVVDVVPVVQEGGPGDSEDGEKKLCVTTEEVSSFGAKNSAIQREKEASGIAGDTDDLKNEAWSANDARVDALDITWSAKEARVEVHVVVRSTGDCNNGAQVSAAADDGGSQVDALVQPEVSSEERNDKGYTGANEAAVVNDGGNSPLEAMEPKEPAVEESVPAVDDRLNCPAVEEDLPAAEGETKDSNDGSTPMKGEALPSGSSPEVDTERTTADEAKPLAEKKGGPEIQEHKKDELVGLVEQDEQCDPKVKTKDAPGADDTEMVSEERVKKVPRAGALESPGPHCYQEGDEIMGLVRCINGYGAFLDHGDMNVLIPAEGNNAYQFKFGDTVNGTVKRVEDDGTIILDTFLVLEEDVEDSSSTLRKWKPGGWSTWWTDSWYAGQWYQDSNGQWDWKQEEEQSDEELVVQELSSEERKERQLYGEKIYKALLENGNEEEAYVGKITGMLLGRPMEDLQECVADQAFLNAEARRAYGILQNDGWKPDGTESTGLGKLTTFSRKQYHNALFELACRKRRFSRPVVGEAVATVLNQGEDEFWNALWLDTKLFLQELDGAVQSMSKRENKPMEAYMDPDQYKKAYMTPKTVLSPGYSKLCRFFNKGRCRNGDGCPYEHRRYGEGWPEGGSTDPKNSQEADDEDGNIGDPPTEEGTVDEAQQEQEDLAFRAKYNFGKGASKGEPTSGEPKGRLCLYYNQGGCKYGTACRYLHNDDVALEGTWEPGKAWDNASRKSLRDAGFHHCCFDYYLRGRCRKGLNFCKYSHDEMSEERLSLLKHLVQVANQVRFEKERGWELTDRSTFQPPASGGAESSSSSAPKALQMTNVSQKDGEKGILDEVEADEQKNSVAASTSTQLHNPEEPIENWMARNAHLWVYTPHVSEVMITLGVTNVSDLQEFIFVEDLVDKGINKVTACKILQLVGEVRYRPGGPEKAVPSDASVRVQQSSGNKGTGRAAVRTLTQVREAEDSGAKTMPRVPYRELFDKVRYRDGWTLAQRSPLCVQKLRLVGVGMPPVNPPTKKYRSRSNPVRRGRPLLDKTQVRQVPRSRSQRRVQLAEVVEKPKPLEPVKPRGGLSYPFSRAWADVVDDDDQAEALVSYAASSSDSSEEETNAVQRLKELFLQERDSWRTASRGNVPQSGSSGSNDGPKKSVHLGEGRDKASRGETRQEVTSQVFSLPQPSRRAERSQKRTRDGSVMVGSLAVGSTEEVLPGQGAAGQVNVSESAQVLPGHEVAGQETAPEGAVQISGEETDQKEGEGGSNDLRGNDAKMLDGGPVRSDLQQLLVKGLLTRIYWKVAVGKLPMGQRDCQKGSNKMDRNLVISMSSEGASEQDENLALEDDADQSMGDGAMVMVYDPGTLIQSPTTDWVMRRGLTDRTVWPAMAHLAQRICAEMVQVDGMNAQLGTGTLLFQRRDQGYYTDLHHSFHDNPCLPAVGNYPLSVMGALLSPGLEGEFKNTDKFGTAMEAIAYDWSRSPGMEVHIELMARVAKMVHPFLNLGAQGSVMVSEFLWQRGRARLMEFLQAATCADQLEALWRRMDDDADEEVDPSTAMLEVLGLEDAVLDQGNNESLIPIEDAGGETSGDTGGKGKAPEVSPEEEKSSGSSRLADTRIFLWSVYSRVASNFSMQDRTTGKIFDSTKGYPGEGPNNDDNPSSKGNFPWISEDYLDEVVSKKMERSSEMDGFVPGSEGSLEKVEVENVTASKILMALWKKGHRVGFRRLRRLNASGCKVGAMKRPIKRVQKIGARKAFMKMFNVFGSSQHGSGGGGKPIMKVVGPRPGFPAVLQAPNTDSTSGEGSSPQVHGNVHVEHSRPMDRYEAERLEKRKKGFCYWFGKGKDRCKFGDDCKFIHSEDDVVLHSYWCKYYVAGRECFAGKDCGFSHDATGVRCVQFARSGRCRFGDRCVFEHGVPLEKQRPRSPRTPPRDGPRRKSGANGGEKEIPPEQFDDDEEDFMVYDEETKMTELLMEAISFLSGGKPDLARAEADPLFKLLKFTGDADQMDQVWVSWTTEMLSVLELLEVVKSYDVSLAEVEEWVNDLRIWYERANLGEEKDPKKGKKRSLEGESSKDIPAEKEVVETSETEVAVEEEKKKVKKKRKAAAIEDPYTLMVPKPKKMPTIIEKGGSTSNVVASAVEKSSKTRTKSNVGGKTKKKEKSQSPKKEEVVMVQDPEEKDRPSDAEAPGPANANEELGQSCQAIEDAKREGLVSSIQRGIQDPILTISDLEYILLQLHLKIANNRKKK